MHKALYVGDGCFSRQGVHFQNKFPHFLTSSPGEQWALNKEMPGTELHMKRIRGRQYSAVAESTGLKARLTWIQVLLWIQVCFANS